jgi:hypothetical protein
MLFTDGFAAQTVMMMLKSPSHHGQPFRRTPATFISSVLKTKNQHTNAKPNAGAHRCLIAPCRTAVRCGGINKFNETPLPPSRRPKILRPLYAWINVQQVWRGIGFIC